MSETRKNKRLLPFPVIAAGSGGDIDAINKVLKHYEGYIIALSTRRFHDEYGNVHLFLDARGTRVLDSRTIITMEAV
jgi:hypothetical protein